MRERLRSSGDNPLTQSGGWKVIPDAGTPAAAPRGGVPQADETTPAPEAEAEAKADEEEVHAEEKQQGDEGGLCATQGNSETEVVPMRQKTSAARRSGMYVMMP